jgi:hypothetical protein
MKQKILIGLLLVGFPIWLLSTLAIYIYGLYLAGTAGSTASFLTSLVPLIGQIYLMWSIWSATGVFFNSYTIAFLCWVALGVLLGNVLQMRR